MNGLLSRVPRRIARTCGVLIALGLAFVAVGGRTFRAAPRSQTRTFLIVRSDIGIHYGKVEEDQRSRVMPSYYDSEINLLDGMRDQYIDDEQGIRVDTISHLHEEIKRLTSDEEEFLKIIS